MEVIIGKGERSGDECAEKQIMSMMSFNRANVPKRCTENMG